MASRVKNDLKSYSCMAKSADGRPARLFVQSFEGDYVAVKPVEGQYDRPLWLSKEDVFRYDPGLLASLEEAYRKGDRGKLSQLWEGCEALAAGGGAQDRCHRQLKVSHSLPTAGRQGRLERRDDGE